MKLKACFNIQHTLTLDRLGLPDSTCESHLVAICCVQWRWCLQAHTYIRSSSISDLIFIIFPSHHQHLIESPHESSSCRLNICSEHQEDVEWVAYAFNLRKKKVYKRAWSEGRTTTSSRKINRRGKWGKYREDENLALDGMEANETIETLSTRSLCSHSLSAFSVLNDTSSASTRSRTKPFLTSSRLLLFVLTRAIADTFRKRTINQSKRYDGCREMLKSWKNHIIQKTKRKVRHFSGICFPNFPLSVVVTCYKNFNFFSSSAETSKVEKKSNFHKLMKEIKTTIAAAKESDFEFFTSNIHNG